MPTKEAKIVSDTKKPKRQLSDQVSAFLFGRDLDKEEAVAAQADKAEREWAPVNRERQEQLKQVELLKSAGEPEAAERRANFMTTPEDDAARKDMREFSRKARNHQAPTAEDLTETRTLYDDAKDYVRGLAKPAKGKAK
jgi:hypothetical protein